MKYSNVIFTSRLSQESGTSQCSTEGETLAFCLGAKVEKKSGTFFFFAQCEFLKRWDVRKKIGAVTKRCFAWKFSYKAEAGAGVTSCMECVCGWSKKAVKPVLQFRGHSPKLVSCVLKTPKSGQNGNLWPLYGKQLPHQSFVQLLQLFLVGLHCELLCGM